MTATYDVNETYMECPLNSGFWVADLKTFKFDLLRSAMGNTVSSSMSPADIAWTFNRRPDDNGRIYPPEHAFNLTDGTSLAHLARNTDYQQWIAPFGSETLSTKSNVYVHGLSQTMFDLTGLSQDRSEEQVLHSDFQMSLPPPGDYQFFSLKLGTQVPVLIALNPKSGLIFAYLPTQKKWVMMAHEHDGFLANTTMAHELWSAEFRNDGVSNSLFVPTEQGLAELNLDYLSLTFQVNYRGNGRCIGAPIRIGDQVWALTYDMEQGVEFIGVDSAGVEMRVPCLGSNTKLATIECCHRPIADRRHAIWMSLAGQYRLQKQNDGSMFAEFIAWSEDIKPEFIFGPPYFAPDGTWWQLCFNVTNGEYGYIDLGSKAMAWQSTQTPRMSSGCLTYRFEHRSRNLPWLDEGVGFDGDTIVVPMIESLVNSDVLAYRIKSADGIKETLAKPDRMRLELIVDTASGTQLLHVLSVSEPRRLRCFVHENILWVYHPIKADLAGWSLDHV